MYNKCYLLLKYQQLDWYRYYKHCQIHQDSAICKEIRLTKEVGGSQWVQGFLLGW